MASEVDQIKERLSIVEVVSSYVKLEKAGVNLRARCPFHSEKTPSFFVSPLRNSYYCFGCGAKGDVFSFVQAFEGLDFLGALKLLASRAGVSLPRWDPKTDDERQQLFRILEAATSFYEQGLAEDAGALLYLKERGLTETTIRHFRLGFAKPAWRSLYEHLRVQGFSDPLLSLSGLVKETERGHYDRFRGRIMFPIAETGGRIIAFSGRLFGERPQTAQPRETAEEAKYVNSPETPLFSKSKILYAFDKAKTSIRKNNFSIVVEGQMDLLMSHQSGYTNTVALSGTALTKEQLILLNRLSQNVVFAFDADRAGILSSGRSAELALSLGMNVKVAGLPKGSDPADLILRSAEEWRRAIRESEHIVDFYLTLLEKEEGDMRTRRLKAHNAVLPFVAKIENKIDQAHFVSRVASKLNLPEEPIWEELRKVAVLEKSEPEARRKEFPLYSRKEKVVRKLLGILLWQESEANAKEASQALREKLVRLLGSAYVETSVASDDIKNEMVFEAEAAYQNTAAMEEEIEELLRYLSLENVREELSITTEKLRQAEAKHDTVETERLLAKARELSQSLSTASAV
ncbi:DNA primase [Candidatus Kaiserbacteria bacterium RIFCSPHIGHO2_02_FULL_50_9]|nr:MAG: DNA primase [Candidatus Kaiserbacteria bacterium RIFCSPHIGHO2_02_FULL_50_9]